MKKKLFYLVLLLVGFATGAWAQSAVLTRGGEPVASFLGPASLNDALNAAEPSGDVIVLSSGTYNAPGEIKKSVSIYGKGYDDVTTRTYINGKLQYRSNGEGSLDGIHLEGLYLANHFNLLNDNDRNPINNLTVEKCHLTGMFIYMNSDSITLRNCVFQGDLKSYPGTYKSTHFLIENCWKDGGSINYFSTDSEITFKNCIINWRSLSGFDNSSSYALATYENCVLSGGVMAANSTLTNCALINVNAGASGVTTTDCTTAASVAEVFDNVSTLAYSDGVVPEVQTTFVGTDGTPIGITGGTTGWGVTPTPAPVNITTTLTKDTDGFYKIGTVGDWVEFKRVVETINPAVNAKMTADIDLGDVQAMVGNGHYNNASYRRAFGGIFDGQGHTLTIHFVTDSIQQQLLDAGYSAPSYLGCAPFGYVWGGTIRNLHTAGTIIASIRYAAGIVGWTNGSVLIENCHSSVNITFPNDNYGMAGIACDGYNDSPVLTIRDCIYDGTMTAGNDKRYSAGLVIYRDYGPINFINTLSIATYANGLGTSGCATFVRNGLGGGVISNSFYKTALGEAQGVQTTADELTNGRTAFYLQNGRSELVWGQEIGVDPQPVLTTDESKRVYRSATGYTNNPAEAINDQSLVPLTYTIDSNNALTITGFDPGFTPPADYDLVIPDEIDGHPVVAIANSAFRGNTNIRSVTANSVTQVGEYAFEKNSSLVSITMNEVLTLKRAAFDICSSLTTINMPKVETLGDIVFGTATSLTEVSLPKAKTLGVETFGTCANLAKVSLPEATTLGNGVFLKGYALTHTGVDGLYIPNVTTIGSYLFRSCTALDSVSMPNVTAIGTYTFDGCTALTSVDLPLITSIPERAFQNCSALPAFNNTVTSIGNYAFTGCSQLSSINKTALQSIGSYAFQNCSSLPAFDCPTVTSLGNNVFEGCTQLVSANLPNVTSMGTGVFHQCTTLDFDQVYLPKMTSLPNYTFQSCTGITNVTFPNDRMPLVTSIGAYAFRYDTGIRSVTINNNMTLGGSCFSECSNNRSFTAPLMTAIPEYAFVKNDSLTTLDLPEVLTIERNAFDYCISLPTLSLPKVVSIGNYAFGTNSSLTEVSLPVCTTLGTEVFGTCTSLTKAYLPEVTTMGTRMFYKNTSLQTLGPDAIYMPKMTTIPEGTFRECTNMVSAPLHSGITSIGNNAFYQDTNLQSVTIPSTVTSIGNSAFRYCSVLNNVVLPGHLTSIQDWSFANCTALENLTIEEGVTSINRDVFQYSGMKKVVLPASIGTLGINLFYQCNQLDTLDLSKCVNVWELYYYTTLRGGNTLFNGVPTTTKIILPPYTKATLGANDERKTIDFDLAQDSLGYYLIADADDWDKFVVFSRMNPTANARLTADIDLTGHVGKIGVGNDFSNYIAYEGTFDGQYHKVTLNNKTNKNITGGLFSWVKNANIQRLFVDGNIDTEYLHTGGFVGGVVTALTMNDCESRVHITGHTETSKNMSIGGFVGHGGNQYAVQLTDCLFSGNIDGGTNVGYVAPLVGWTDSSRNTVYTNCLNNGTFNANPSSTYVLGDGQYITAISCYYKSGTYSSSYLFGTAVSTEQLATGQTTYRLQGGRTEQHWGQIIGTDPAPRLTNEAGTMVYRGNTYTNEYVEYAGLQKDADDYYLIGGTADWEEFCLLVQDFPLSNARMTADVEVMDNSMVGSSSVHYSGTFDGQGHTLTINYTAAANYWAPFRYIEGATLRNIHVAGKLSTATRFCGGLVASTYGSTTIDNCWSSVEIESAYSGDACYGGLVSCNETGTLTINNCKFSGRLVGTSAYTWGGIVGWRRATVVLNNSLFTPAYYNVGTSYTATFVGNGATITNCYSEKTMGAVQGTQVTAEQLDSGYVAYKLQGKNDSLVWAQTIGVDSVPQLVIFNSSSQRVYRTSIDSYSNDQEAGMMFQDEQGYYLLRNLDDWKFFSMLVEEGEYEAKAKMTADIDLGDDQTQIGSPKESPAFYFKGIFDGQGHTLTVHYVPNGANCLAPFPSIADAVVRNLHIDGTITNSAGYQPAAFGRIGTGTSTLENIWSSLVITNTGTSWREAAGIVGCVDGYVGGHLIMRDCVFTGSVTSNGSYDGCLIGYINSGGSATVSNCLSTGTFNLTGGSPGIRGNYTNTYILQFTASIPSNMQCTAATLADGTVATALQAGRSEEIWVQDATINQPMLKLFAHRAVDVPLMLDILLGKVSAAQYPEADLNGDNQVTLADLTMLINQLKQSAQP